MWKPRVKELANGEYLALDKLFFKQEEVTSKKPPSQQVRMLVSSCHVGKGKKFTSGGWSG